MTFRKRRRFQSKWNRGLKKAKPHSQNPQLKRKPHQRQMRKRRNQQRWNHQLMSSHQLRSSHQKNPQLNQKVRRRSLTLHQKQIQNPYKKRKMMKKNQKDRKKCYPNQRLKVISKNKKLTTSFRNNPNNYQTQIILRLNLNLSQRNLNLSQLNLIQNQSQNQNWSKNLSQKSRILNKQNLFRRPVKQ